MTSGRSIGLRGLLGGRLGRLEGGDFGAQGGDLGLRKHAGKAQTGRVPVGVLTVFIEDGQTKTDRAIYQLGYSIHRRTLRADKVELEGLSLAQRGVSGDLQAAAGNLWSAR